VLVYYYLLLLLFSVLFSHAGSALLVIMKISLFGIGRQSKCITLSIHYLDSYLIRRSSIHKGLQYSVMIVRSSSDLKIKLG